MRRLDIGIASYGNPDALRRALGSLVATCRTEWRCLIVGNVHPDPEVHARAVAVAEEFVRLDPQRFVFQNRTDNIGYAGAVNEILKWAETEYIAYSDNDAVVLTEGWDRIMTLILDRFHEIGMIFPAGGPFPIYRGPYTEILWGVGCFWLLSRMALSDVELFDTRLGHHEEVDYQTRLRLAGYKIASCREVQVHHEASASSSPAATERINHGVRAWMDKWCAYFCGKGVGYHSPNVLRHTDWPPMALYLEEYWREHLPDLNANPESVVVDGVEYDLVKVPRPKGFYRHRVI